MRTALCILAEIVIYAALSGLMSLLIVQGKMDETWVLPCIYAAACAAAWIGGSAALRFGQNGSESICAAALWAVAMAMGLISGGSIDVKKAVLLALPILIGCMVAVWMQKGKVRPIKKRRRSRK